jgi:hypothetical protein
MIFEFYILPLAQEAIKQAAPEIALAQTAVSQVQSAFLT